MNESSELYFDRFMLPKILTQKITSITGTNITKTTPTGGGSICNAARLDMADDRQLLVKWRSRSVAGMFTAEAKGLQLMRATDTLRIPAIVIYEESDGDCPAFIVMEWLGQGGRGSDTGKALGHGLAEMHRHTNDVFGLDHDNLIGANPQPNQPADNWVDFFREQRLGFQMELAGRNGYLHKQRAKLLERLLARLDDWLPANPPASLLHGDLWGGNWIVTDAGDPALIDPAVYYGHREAELAFTELFGGFPASFYQAYNESWSLDSDYTKRKDLYNLYHLLNHLNLFGEGYGGQVDGILRRYA
jgi:fructosamine-3-kinase